MSTVEKIDRSIEQYLAYDDALDGKSEYFDGEIFDMAGGTILHGTICSNITRALGNALQTSKCIVTNSDVKVFLEAANSFVYPDLSVICNKVEYGLDRKDILANPTLIVEVLSPSTGGFDRGGKFSKYQSLESLREYVLVEQGHFQVDVFFRREDGQWLYNSYKDPAESVKLQSLKVEISMADIYRNIEFFQEEEVAGEK